MFFACSSRFLRTPTTVFVLVTLFLYLNLVRHIMMQQDRLRTDHPTTHAPITRFPTVHPTTKPTTASPSRSPTFFDYINEVFTLSNPVVGAKIGSVHNSTKLCSAVMPNSVAVLYYTNRSLDSLTPKPLAFVVMDGVIVAHDWGQFLAHLPRMRAWVGDETSNCQNWSSAESFGLMMGSKSVDFECTEKAKLLCLRLITLS